LILAGDILRWKNWSPTGLEVGALDTTKKI